MSNPAPQWILATVEDLEDLYETAPCGYLSISPNGSIAKCNGTLLAWVGHDRDDLVGSRLSALLSLGSRIYYETHVSPVLHLQGEVNEVALELATGGGAKMPVLANLREKRDAAGQLQFVRITVQQAGDRYHFERGLLAARDHAEADLAASEAHIAATSGALKDERELATLREQFVAVLGHDLRNPLASILGGVRLLANEELTARGSKVLTLMEGSVARASRLVDDVMDFARSRLGGGIGLERDFNMPLGPLIEQVVSEMRTIAPGREIILRLAIDRPVHCDRARIGQLLSNLLGNAVAHGAHDQPIVVDAETREGLFVLTVTNGGAAIPEAALAKIFQPFFRGSVRPSQQGLGLGLHIASEIAKAHHGKLEASSTDRETSFRLTMPEQSAAVAEVDVGPEAMAGTSRD